MLKSSPGKSRDWLALHNALIEPSLGKPSFEGFFDCAGRHLIQVYTAESGETASRSGPKSRFERAYADLSQNLASGLVSYVDSCLRT